MDCINFWHHLTRYADGLDSHNHSSQSPLSDVRRPAVRDDFVPDLVSREPTNKVAFRDLA